jgi:hypothetical protein
MTIDEAIQYLNLHASTIEQSRDTKLHIAIKLSIEALKAVIRLRQLLGFQADAKLPGETVQ